jgi:hypothetical protein
MLEWLTGLLALMTGWLAWETRDMARATKKMAALGAEAYLAFSRIELDSHLMRANATEPERRGYNVRVVLVNPGQVRIGYEVTEILVTIADCDYPPNAESFDNRGGYVHPREEVKFSYPFFECPVAFGPGLMGYLNFETRFSAVDSEAKTLTFRLRFWVVGVDDGGRRIDWRYLSGPTYG